MPNIQLMWLSTLYFPVKFVLLKRQHRLEIMKKIPQYSYHKADGKQKIDGIPDLQRKLRNMDLTNQFDSLPDELLLKIVKMASLRKLSDYSANKYNHNFIISSVGRLSSRFKRIAQDASLWKDLVSLDWWQHWGQDVGFQVRLTA